MRRTRKYLIVLMAMVMVATFTELAQARTVTLSSRITITVMPAPPAVTQLAGQNVPQGIANSFEKFKEESGGRALLKLEHPSASRNDIPTYTASEIL